MWSLQTRLRKHGKSRQQPTSDCLHQGFIQGCRFQIDIQDYQLCISCQDRGFYVHKIAEKPLFCGKLPEGMAPIENCQWGGIYDVKNNRITCFKCKNGYSLSRNLGRCFPWVLKGCLLGASSTYCVECDVYDGWSMQADKTCAKA